MDFVRLCTATVWLLSIQTSGATPGKTPRAAMRCKYNQIEWVKHGKIVACQACPQCTPGEESSLMCGTRIESGTLSVCRPCKEGTYSDRFDAIPCKPCTRCSTGRVVLRNCTSTENAKCGKCMSGYYELPVVADCRKCVQCCHDGKDKKTPGCAVVGLCMERHEGCPETTPRTPNIPSTSLEPTTRTSTSSQSTPSPASSVTQLLDVTRSKIGHDTSSVTTLPVPQTPDPTTQLQSGDSHTYPYVTMGSTMGLVIVVLIGSFIVFFCKRKGNWNQNIPSDALSVQLPFLQRDTEVELNKAVDWLNGELGPDAHENAKDACTELDKEKRGTYQYVAVGVRFHKTKTKLDGHSHAFRRPGGSATYEFLEALVSERPDLTVKELAEKIKPTSNKVYDLMKPYFYRSSDQEAETPT